MKPWQRAALATAAIGLVAALVLGQFSSAQVWTGLTPGNCTEYCENYDRCDALSSRPAVQQPLNTWSNLSYVFVACLVLLLPGMNASRWLFATSMLLLGVGSFLFHATITREFQWLDVVGMYAVLVALGAIGFVQIWDVPQFVAVGVALVTDLLLAVFKWQLNTFVMIPALGLGVAALVGIAIQRDGYSGRDPLLALGLMGVAFLLQRLDVSRTICVSPTSWFQGHAVWHVLTASALYLVFRFFLPWPPGGGGGRRQQPDPDWYREAA